jgi:signal transduction histidine kinase/CHASE3 domain sensor protein
MQRTPTHMSFRRRLINTIALPVSLMLLLAGVSIWQISRLLWAIQWVEHTDQVIAQANQVERLFSEAESGLRGYLLTGEPSTIDPYQQGEVLVKPSFETLVDLVSDNPAQGQRLAQVGKQYQQWNSSTPLLRASNQQGEAPSISLLKERNQLMMAIRNEMSEFIRTEEQLRDTRSQTVQRTTKTVVGTSIALATALGAILAYFIWRQISSVSRSYQHALRIAHEQTQSVQRSAERLAILHEIDQAILAAQSVESLAHETLSKLKGISAYKEGAVILLRSSSDSNGTQILAEEVDTELAGAIVLMTEQGALNPLSCGGSICYVKDISALADRSPVLEALLAEGYHSFLTVPLRVEGHSIGDLHWFAAPVDAFNAQKQEVFREVSAQLAIAIQQSKLRSQLQKYAAELEQRVIDRTARLQTANEELEAFSYTVAHDLRAPLRGIEGYATALIEDYGEKLDAIAHDYTQQIMASIQRMNRLVQDLLAYSHLSREEMKLSPVSLTQVITEAQAQLKSELEERHADITVVEPLPKVMGHPSTLVQVIVNLLSNAAKFAPVGIQPRIRIWAEEKNPWVRLWVEDNGIGIEPQYREQIFGVFERLHARETYPGTGIGLAIVRKGAERLGGRAGVESTPGQGSQFWVELEGVKP